MIGRAIQRRAWPRSLLVVALIVSPAVRAHGIGDGGDDGDGEKSRRPKGSAASGEHYQVYAHFRTKDGAARALDVVERAWPAAMKLVGFERGHASAVPDLLEVHVYPNKESYAVWEERLTKGYFRDNQSFSHWDSRTAHVALAPPPPRGSIGLPLLSSQTREALAHEAGHLAVYAVLPNYRWHPTWFAEGLAMAVEREVAGELGLLDTLVEHPRFSSNLLRAKRMLAAGRLPPLEDLLHDETKELTSEELYSLWQILFDTLCAHPNFLPELSHVIAQAGRGQGVRDRAFEFVARQFGLGRLDEELRSRIESSTPAWEEIHRSLDTSQELWVQRAFAGVDALAWRIVPRGEEVRSLVGSVTLLAPGTKVQLRLGREPSARVVCSIGSGVASLALSSPQSGPENAEREDLRPLEPGVEHAFLLRIEDARVLLEIDHREVVRVRTPEGWIPPSGPFALGVSPGGAVSWRDVELR